MKCKLNKTNIEIAQGAILGNYPVVKKSKIKTINLGVNEVDFAVTGIAKNYLDLLEQ